MAYCFGRRTHKSFEELLSLLNPFKVKLYFSDDWQAYSAYIPEKHHQIGKINTQKIKYFELHFLSPPQADGVFRKCSTAQSSKDIS